MVHLGSSCSLPFFLPCVPLAAADGATVKLRVQPRPRGDHPDGSVELTGSSTLPSTTSRELIDASTGAALVTGTYLDSVAPNADGSWSWSHNLSLVDQGAPAGSGGPCAPDLQRHELVVFLGAACRGHPYG